MSHRGRRAGGKKLSYVFKKTSLCFSKNIVKFLLSRQNRFLAFLEQFFSGSVKTSDICLDFPFCASKKILLEI